MGHQPLVGAGPGGSQPVHGGHGRVGIALGDGVLEAFQEYLPDGLLVGKDSHAVAVCLLVVEGEVLHVGDDALLSGAPHLGGADLPGEEAILGVIFEVPPAVGGAVDVHAGGVPARHPRGDGVLAHAQAQAVDQLGIPGAGHHHLHRVGHGALASHQGAGDAGGAVLVLSGGQADAVHLDGGVAPQPHQPHGLIGGQLLRQLLPCGIAVVRPNEVGRPALRLGLKGGHGFRAGPHHVNAPLPLQILQQGTGGLPGAALVGFRPGARPVAPGQVAEPAVIVADVRVLELVGDGFAGGQGDGVGGAVLHVHGGFPCHGRVAVGVHPVCRGEALCRQDIVQPMVRIVPGSKVVVPRIQDVGPRSAGVVGLHDFLGHGDRDRLRLARLQQAGLGKAHQLHGGLLHPVGPIVVGIGGLHIDLHHVLARPIPGVGHGDRCLKAVAGFLHLVVRPLELGIGQAVAEGELNCGAVVVVPGVPLAQHPVLIPRFIIAVTHIDALGVHQVLPAVGDSAVGDGVVPQVGGGGGAEGVVGVGVHQPPGGVDRPRQRLADGINALLAHAAAPQAGLYVGVGRILQEAQLQGVVAVEHQHHRVEAAAGHGQQIQLVLVQLQIAVAGSQGLGGNV